MPSGSSEASPSPSPTPAAAVVEEPAAEGGETTDGVMGALAEATLSVLNGVLAVL